MCRPLSFPPHFKDQQVKPLCSELHVSNLHRCHENTWKEPNVMVNFIDNEVHCWSKYFFSRNTNRTIWGGIDRQLCPQLLVSSNLGWQTTIKLVLTLSDFFACWPVALWVLQKMPQKDGRGFQPNAFEVSCSAPTFFLNPISLKVWLSMYFMPVWTHDWPTHSECSHQWWKGYHSAGMRC